MVVSPLITIAPLVAIAYEAAPAVATTRTIAGAPTNHFSLGERALHHLVRELIDVLLLQGMTPDRLVLTRRSLLSSVLTMLDSILMQGLWTLVTDESGRFEPESSGETAGSRVIVLGGLLCPGVAA